MPSQALILNADYQPLKIVSYQRAVNLILEGTAYLVKSYDFMLRSPSMEMEWPAVVALKKYISVRPRVKFSRQNVMARDQYICQYCGNEFPTHKLTLDHVVPRAQAKGNRVKLPWNGKQVHVTCWENIVSSCAPCNSVKGARTPGQAGMDLLNIPQKPTPWQCVLMPWLRRPLPEEWQEFVPEEWRDYWTTELDPD